MRLRITAAATGPLQVISYLVACDDSGEALLIDPGGDSPELSAKLQQEAINQKLAADELAQADRLIQSAEEKQQKAVKLEMTQPEVYLKYQREAKAEFEQAHKRSIKSEIYALRNQQMVFGWLSK